MYEKALSVGMSPSEFWECSLKEVRDIVTYRIENRNKDNYSLASLIRIAIASCFSKDVRFPSYEEYTNQGETDNQNNWKNSYNYMKALQEKQRRCKKK